MSGSFSKEQRRNLVKAVGATAFEAMEQARQLAFMTETRAAAMAKEFLNFEKTTRETVERQDAQLKQLEGRCNGLGEWCQGNEDTQAAETLVAARDIATLKGRLDATDQEVRTLQLVRGIAFKTDCRLQWEIDTLRYAGFWQRLRWLLTGRLPAASGARGLTVDQGTRTENIAGVIGQTIHYRGPTTMAGIQAHPDWPRDATAAEEATLP